MDTCETDLGVAVPEVVFGVAGAAAGFVDAPLARAGAAAGALAGAGGGGVGLEPPMLSEMVGGGAGASVCGGRSMGARGGGAGCGGALGVRKVWPGTKLKALTLSLLILAAIAG